MALRFWVGGTGTWDSSTTTHWAASTGTAGGQTVPGAADTVIFDANSGGGTVTVNTTVNCVSITMGAFTGTLDFSANNNNVTLQSFSGNGSGVRALNMGNGTWTLSSSWVISAGNLTFNANSSVLTFTVTSAAVRSFTGAGLTYSTVTISPNSLGGQFQINGAVTIGTLNINAGNYVEWNTGTSYTITTLNVSGSSSSLAVLKSSITGLQVTLSIASNPPTIAWAAIRDLNFTGGATFAVTNSFDLGHNSGITITAPLVRHPPTYQIGI